jgi:hypothetical protein
MSLHMLLDGPLDTEQRETIFVHASALSRVTAPLQSN